LIHHCKNSRVKLTPAGILVNTFPELNRAYIVYI